MPTTTYHTYSDLLIDGGRLAATEWGLGGSLAGAVAATLRRDSDAIILRVTGAEGTAIGLAPAGLAA